MTGSDPNSPPRLLSFTVSQPPAHGTLTGTVPDLFYTPDPGFVGSDTFQFTDSNGVATSNPATVSITVGSVTQPQSPITNGDSYTTKENTTLTVAAPGVLGNDDGFGAVLTGVLMAGPAHGTLQFKTDGSFVYTPAPNYSGTDSFSYQAAAGTTVGNVAVVQLTITSTSTTPPSPVRLLPDTRYYNYVRKRRSINPTRFDFYHPQIGALIGLELSGLPTKATIIVPANAHFDATADRAQFDRNAAAFEAKQPVLGALFQLEAPWNGQTDLLPDTTYYIAQKALYEANPAQYQREKVYLGAIFAIERAGQGGTFVVSTAAAGGHVRSSVNSRLAISGVLTGSSPRGT